MIRLQRLVDTLRKIAPGRCALPAVCPKRSRALAAVGLLAFLGAWSVANDAAAVQLQTGLIAYWNLDDGIGLTAADTAPAGVSNDSGALGTGANTPTWIGGKFGYGLRFDGVNDYVHIASSTDLNIGTNAVSMSAWVNLDVLPSAVSTFGPIYDSAGDSYVLYLQQGVNELRFKVTTTNGAARPGIPQAALSTGSWHHLAAVYNGAAGAAGTAKIYWDGVLMDTHTGDDGTPGTGLTGNVTAGQVARMGNDTGTSYYAGALDDLGVWNRALTDAEVAYIASGGGRTLAAPAPVIHWTFDGNAANTGTGGPAYNATIVHGNASNAYVSGRHGQALVLGNTPGTSVNGDYVSTPYTFADQGTVSLWYRPEAWYNYQTIFDNSVNPDYWEFWIYADGNARFRVNNDAGVTYDLDNLGGPNRWYHMAVTWNRNGSNVDLQLFVNGILRSTATSLWRDPGATFFLGGGNNGNTYGNGAWDDVQVYERVLSAQDIFAMANVPEPAAAGLLALGGVCSTLALRRRGRSARARG